jgi:hypothetical protein
MGLFRCDHCPKSNTGWSWSCFETEICDLNEDLGDCDVVKNGNSASGVFVFFEGVAVLLNLMVIERIVIYLMRRTFGVTYLVYIFSGVSVVMHIIAFAAWNSIIDPSYEGDCDEFTIGSTDTTEVCAMTGPKLAAANIVISLIAAVFFCVNFYRRDSELDVVNRGLADDAFLCMSNRLWFIGLVVGAIFTLIFLIAAWATESWVERSADDIEFTGSLTT